jgi:hypothetical protein
MSFSCRQMIRTTRAARKRNCASNGLHDAPNQAMQLTESKVYASSVCRRASMLRGMHRGLAAADLLSR